VHRSVRCRVVCAARKTNETSIRLALGATRVQVLGSVLKEGMLLVIAGMAISVPATLAATRLITSLLFGVKAADLNSLGLNTPVVRIGCANHSWRRLINWEKTVRP
jgi:ABC-type antimicrobial peptide transport system permease subunit